MTKVKAAGINADALKAFFDRLENVDAEIVERQGLKRDIYAEAKGVGYDVATMRRVFTLRKKDQADRDEAETLLDVYCHALGMEPSGRVIELQPSEEVIDARAEKVAAQIAAEVDRCMRLTNDGTPAKIAAIMQELECSSGKASKIRRLIEERLAAGISFSLPRAEPVENENETVPASTLPCATIWQEVTGTREEHIAEREAERAAAAERRRIEREAAATEAARLARLNGEDMPDFPPGFDRRVQVSA